MQHRSSAFNEGETVSWNETPVGYDECQSLIQQISNREQETQRKLDQAYLQLEAYARDIRRVWEMHRERVGLLRDSWYETTIRLARACELRDLETSVHTQRISHLARLTAELVGLDARAAELIVQAAPMHDVGKIAIPDSILKKQCELTAPEWETMKSHTVIGGELLNSSPSPLLQTASQIALTHHERWDGSGYPNHLAGEDIPISGRIVMLCDVYDALRSWRPYKAAFSHKRACQVILSGDQRTQPAHFDPKLLDVFENSHEQFRDLFDRLTA